MKTPKFHVAIIAPVTHYCVGGLEGQGNQKFGDVVDALNAALEVDPNNIDVLNWRGVQMQRAGYIDRGIDDHARCIELDEASSACRYNLMSGLAIKGRVNDTLEELYDALDNGAFGQDTLILLVLSEIERRDLFLFAGGGNQQLRGWTRFGDLYDALQSPAKDHTEIRAEISKTFEENNLNVLAADILLSALGDEEAVTAGAVWWFETHANYRQTPQFKKTIIDVGIYEYWVANGFPDKCKPIGSADFACE